MPSHTLSQYIIRTEQNRTESSGAEWNRLHRARLFENSSKPSAWGKESDEQSERGVWKEDGLFTKCTYTDLNVLLCNEEELIDTNRKDENSIQLET